MRRRALLLGLGLSAAACGPKARPALPPAPAVTSAAELIPPDLDVVVRFDLARVKAALGAIALTALAQQVLAKDGSAPETDKLLVSSLLGAEQVYLGYRPSALWAPLDRVLAMQGRFEPWLRPPAGFTGATDLGRDFRYWDAKIPPPKRGDVARIYAAGEQVRAFVSEAELDAVERALSGQASPRRLEAPEEGTLSLAARPRLLGRLAGGTLRELLEDAQALRAVAELDSDRVRLKLELLVDGAEQAQQLASAGKLVLARAVEGLQAVDVTLDAQGARVLLSARLTRAQLQPLLLTFWGGPTG